MTVRADRACDLADFWVVAFDGAGEDDAKCAMIAEELESSEYTGVLTYDPDIVDELSAYLDGIGG